MRNLVVLMGVSGTGKTTVGHALAELTHWTFYDGDDFQTPANIAKMSSGQPLTDADRQGWLASLAALIKTTGTRSEDMILACSALKEAYREQLRQADASVRFVYLKGSPELIRERLAARQNHFFKADMLASQLAAFEVPKDAVVVDIAPPPAAIAATIVSKLAAKDSPVPPQA